MKLFSLPNKEYATCIDFSPDGSQLAVGYDDGTVYLWDLKTGEYRLTMKGHSDVVDGVDFSPDGKRLLTSSGDGKSKVWDVATGT